MPGVLVYRVDAELFFANAPTVRHDLLERLDERDEQVRLVVFDMRSSPTIDLTAADMFADLHERLAHRGIDLRLAEADGAVRDVLALSASAHPLCETPVNEGVATTIESWQRSQEQ
ncbi:sodium-independent anion transporter [Halomicroarcula sp. GCM10025709]|uniref:sodium-independent anion transporter n=1 Tax=Halomicroarcula sp. GCM10025709 TaxID=3252669 RepID=UPI0036186C7D